MSLNFDGRGRKIAKIRGGAKQKTLFLDENFIVAAADLETDEIQRPIRLKDESSICPYCEYEFKRKSDMNRHVRQSCPLAKMVNDVMNEIELPTKKKGVKEKPKKVKGISLENGILRISDKSVLVPLPNKEKREIPYIAGPQGSGKSYYTSQYLKEFQKAFPKKKIYMFSGIDEDINFKDIKGINKMDMNDDSYLEDPIDPKTELSNSLVIFDDIDRSNNPEMTDYLHELRSDILKNGRDQSEKQKDIYCLSTNHLVTDHAKTRDLLNECTSITVFPHSGSRYGIERVLKYYLGFGKKEIDKIMKLGSESRWVTIYKCHPQYILWAKGAIMGKDL
jgi:hypothetical protein